MSDVMEDSLAVHVDDDETQKSIDLDETIECVSDSDLYKESNGEPHKKRPREGRSSSFSPSGRRRVFGQHWMHTARHSFTVTESKTFTRTRCAMSSDEDHDPPDSERKKRRKVVADTDIKNVTGADPQVIEEVSTTVMDGVVATIKENEEEADIEEGECAGDPDQQPFAYLNNDALRNFHWLNQIPNAPPPERPVRAPQAKRRSRKAKLSEQLTPESS